MIAEAAHSTVSLVDVLRVSAAVIIGAAAVATALAVLARFTVAGKPVRWLWRTNVSEPVGKWNRGIVEGVVDDRISHLMTHKNGGSSLKDLADSVSCLRRSVRTLLKHDAERDTEGKRYGAQKSPTPHE